MKTRKDIIKNVAIIFLSIMLVLTFFSNTILNWSLPQVSGKYTEYGEIKTGVRGSGTVASNMTYTETVKGDRKIERVWINRGATVNEGDILMTLSATDVDGIEALEAELKSLQEAYDRALLTKESPDYTLDEMNIARAEEDLAALEAERALYTDDYIAETKAALEAAEAKLEALGEKLDGINEKINELTEKSDDPAIASARQYYLDAVSNREAAENALALLTYTPTDGLIANRDSISSDIDRLERELDQYKSRNSDIADIIKNYNTATSEWESAVKEHESAETAFNTANAAYLEAKAAYEADTSPLPDAEKPTYIAMVNAETAKNTAETALNDAASKRAEKWSAYESAKALYDAKTDEIDTYLITVEDKEYAISERKTDLASVRRQITKANEGNRDYNNQKDTVELKKLAEEKAKEALDAAIEGCSDGLTAERKATEKEIKAAEKELSEAQEAVAKLDTVESLDSQIKSAKRDIEMQKFNLEQKKESDAKADKLSRYDLNKQYQAILEKKAEIEKKKGGSKEGYELKASHAGTVTAVNFSAGQTVVDGAEAVVIEVVESGYTLSFSVSNAEAQKVKVGDSATVSDTYWGQKVGAVLDKIIPDAGGKTKTLVFELDGNVNAGQTLTLLVGERSTGYSAVIPKSALREDSKGKFVYITKTKSTPLGNRYVVTRLDVNVAAEDDKNVAITTDESYIYEYVIVSSTKPFEEGEYVRLSD